MSETDHLLCNEDHEAEPFQGDGQTTEALLNTLQTPPIVSAETPATIDTSQITPLTSGPAPALVLSNTAQPIGGPNGGLGQTVFFATPTNPNQLVSNPVNLGTSIRFILNGQTITFLPTAQPANVTTSQNTNPNILVNGNSSAKLFTEQSGQINFSSNNPTNTKSNTAVVPAKNLETSSVHTDTTTGNMPAGQLSCLQGPPSTVPSSLKSKNKRRIEPKMDFPGSSKVFKKSSSGPQSCGRCWTPYQKSDVLRGYFCQCNKDLVKRIKNITSLIKKKIQLPKALSEPSVSETCASFSKPSQSAPNVMASEIPEGTPSPVSRELDNHERMIMLVEDYYYGQKVCKPVQVGENSEVPPVRCMLCSKKLAGNIMMMNHMKHHIELDHRVGEVGFQKSCHHCFRTFLTPSLLQCHLKEVHSDVDSSKVCKICELSFENEPLFLNHMKHTHKPGEMPYTCVVCGFRSSFHRDVMEHFADQHKDTSFLLCPFCLKGFRSFIGYQMHCTKHQKKPPMHCNKCRLQFFMPKNRLEHKLNLHNTCVKPKQLVGLQSGTKIIIRAYTSSSEDTKEISGISPLNTSTPVRTTASTASLTSPVPQNITSKVAPTRKNPVEIMEDVLVKFQKQCNPSIKYFCVECNFDISTFYNHFPTYVRCSLCRFRTCCARAYADHMISSHVSRKNAKKYITLYRSCPKKGILGCSTCRFRTRSGDIMAKHLADNPDHQASICSLQEGFSRGFKRFVFIPTDLLPGTQRLPNRILLPLQLQQGPMASKPLQPPYSVSLPVAPAHTRLQPALPEKERNPLKTSAATTVQKNPEGSRLVSRRSERPLSTSQLKVVLYTLCYGVPQAASHFDMHEEHVQALLSKRQMEASDGREDVKEKGADDLVEWIHCRREQQLPIDEGNLFEKAYDLLWNKKRSTITYAWMIAFLLARDLGLQASAKTLTPRSQQLELSYHQFLINQISSQGFGLRARGAMDELSIFVDMGKLKKSEDSYPCSALKLIGTSAPLMEVMLAALADGTILPTMVFLQGEDVNPEDVCFSDSIVFESRAGGFTHEERLRLWLDKVWCRHIDASSGNKGLLMMDPYRGHTSREFLADLNSASTMPCLIPHGCSSRLQPLEICVGSVIRGFLQARWNHHARTSPQELVSARACDLAVLVCGWLDKIMKVLKAKPGLLFRSFECVLSLNPGVSFPVPSDMIRTFSEALLGELHHEEAERSLPSDSLPSPPNNALALN